MRAVFHVPANEPGAHDVAIRNVENLLGDDSVAVSDVVVVANGGGLHLLTRDAAQRADVERLLDAGVRFCACRNSLRRADLDAADLIDGVEVVPSAVGELVRLQDEGYAYLRP